MTVPAPTQAGASAGQLIRSMAPLGLVATLVGLVTSFLTPFLPLFLSRELHAGPAMVSLFLFLTPLAAVAVASVIGRLSDRPAMRHRLLIVAGCMGGLGFALFAWLRSYWALLAVALTLVAVAGSLLPQVFALGRVVLDRTYPARAAIGISGLRMLFSVAWVAGPPLAAYLIGAIDFRGLFIVAAAMHVAILPVLVRLREPARPRPSVESTVDDGVTRPRLLLTNVAFILMQCAGGLGVISMPFFVSVELGRSVGDAGLILGLCAALEIPLMLVFGALAARWSLRRLLLIGGGIGVAYFGVVSVSGGVWPLAVAQLLNATFISTVAGLGISYFQDLMPTRVGRATTMFTNTNRLSAMVAGLLFGVVQLVGYRASYAIGAGLCAAGLALLAATRPVARATR